MEKQTMSCITCSIRHCSILKNCRHEFLELIDQTKYYMKFTKGHQLIREGSAADGVFVITSGVVKTHVKGYRKRPFILHLATTGGLLGYQRNEQKKHQVSATAAEDTHVCFIENKEFDLILQKNVGVREDLTREFNKELSKIHMRTVRLAQMSVREKVADAVLLISHAYGMNNSTKPFTVNLSREDIGDLIGCTKEQVSKNFSDFKSEKVITASGKQLQIVNYKKLKEIAGV